MPGFEALPEAVKLAGTVIGVLTTVVVLTVYFTQLKLQGSKQLKESSAVIEQQQSTIAALEASTQALGQSVALLRAGREEAASVLMDIERLMTEGRHMVLATADSVLIPDPYAGDALIFLAVHGSAAQKIKHLRVPVSESAAGRVLSSGSPAVSSPQGTGPRFKQTDEKAGFRTESILSVPLSSAGRVRGVLQYLNRSDGVAFSEGDADAVGPICTEIAFRIERLTKDPAALKLLGIAERAVASDGTFLFLDLTRSTSLFDVLAPADVMSLLNEYYDRTVSRALREGAVLDRVMGDGMLLRFNVPTRVPKHAVVAVQCAHALQHEFVQLRNEWLRVDKPVESLSQRIGISTGTVIAGQLGHPQFLSYSVIGMPVNEAARLCEEARAVASGIAISEATHEAAAGELANLFQFVPLQGGQSGYAVEARS